MLALDRRSAGGRQSGPYEPGTGEINDKNVAKALKKMSYRGAVGLEPHASGDPEAAPEAIKDAFSV